MVLLCPPISYVRKSNLKYLKIQFIEFNISFSDYVGVADQVHTWFGNHMVEYSPCYLFVCPSVCPSVRLSDPEVPFLVRFMVQLINVSGVFCVKFRKRIEESSKIECFRRKNPKNDKNK